VRPRENLTDAIMAGAFLLILFTGGFGLIFALPVIIIPWLFAPRNRTPMKLATFEAGQVPQGDARVHLLMQYYAYLLIFVIVDVVSMFLFAWATVTVLPLSASETIGVFLLMIFIPLGYGIRIARRREMW
jgi:NADH-quinone oxidoreductase subunit A